MSLAARIDQLTESLSGDADLKDKYQTLSDLCDVMESFLAAKEYKYFLEKMVSVLLQLLKDVPISFYTSTYEHKIRMCVLEIVQRLAYNDACDPYKIQILDSVTEALKSENEENGVICIKIITGIHKAYKNDLVDKVHDFINIIYGIYGNAPKVVHHWLDENSSQGTRGNSSSTEVDESEELKLTSEDDIKSKKELLHALHSFKTLSECPITMVSLLSSYKQLVNSVLIDLIPKIIGLLKLEAQAQKHDRQDAESKGLKFISVSKKIKNTALYGDFIISQVKATSFLAYIFIRDYAPEFFSKYHSEIADLVIRLLQDCPGDLAAAKKELLHATRHILSTPHKHIFIPKLEYLLDESVLIGDGLTCHETLRALAYSTIADFVHNIRSKLSPEQLWTVVPMFCKVMKDSSLAPNVSLMCAKLLLNLLEFIVKLPAEDGRRLMMLIIDTFTAKFITINEKYDYYVDLHKQYEAKKEEAEKAHSKYLKENNSSLPSSPSRDQDVVVLDNEKEMSIDYIVDKQRENLAQFLGAPYETDEDQEMKDVEAQEDEAFVSIFTLQDQAPIKLSKKSSADPMKDIRNLVKSFLNYLKPIISNLGLTNGPPPTQDANLQAWKALARGLTVEEMSIFESLFEESLKSIRFFGNEKFSAQELLKQHEVTNGDIRIPNISISASKEEKEAMGVFSILFTSVDPAIFGELMNTKFPYLYEQMKISPVLVHIPQLFLDSQVPSGNFSGTLITFMKQKLPELSSMNAVEAYIYLKLFKFFLYSLTKFQEQNERFLLPHLNDFILKSLEYSRTTSNPMIYFHFIRILFKSVSRGRFEELYKEVIPLLQKTLGSLNKLIDSSRSRPERELCIELCLTIPVRLSKLVNMLHYLMRPLVLALNGSAELVGQGLRTLELCVDNFNPNYFDPIIEPVIDDVMKALWKHLKPTSSNYAFGETVVRILGKFGGRNRNFIKPASDLEVESLNNIRIEAEFNIAGLKDPGVVSVSTGVNTAVKILEDIRLYPSTKMVVHYCLNAFKYLAAVLMLFIDASELPDNYQELVEIAVNTLSEGSQLGDLSLPKELIKDQRKLDNENLLLEKILKAIFYSSQIKEIRAQVEHFIRNLSKHVAQLYITKNLIRKIKHDRNFVVAHGEGKVQLDMTIFFNVIAYSLSSYVPEVRDTGVMATKELCNTCTVMFGSVEDSVKSGLHAALVAVFCHSCYDEMYYNKLGGVLGLEIIIKETGIPMEWFFKFQQDLTRAFFYVLRDTSSIMPVAVVENAKELVEYVIEGCNKNVKSADDVPFDLISSLVYDLASPVAVVREVSQKCIEILANLSNSSIVDLISKCKNVLLSPIFAKPLRALPFLMQIGHIEAITFWLGLPHKEAEFTADLQRHLLEVVSLVEAEDSMLTSSGKLIDFEIREQLTELRVVCIKLLTVALSKAEYAMTEPGLTRLRILAIFFKTLSSPEKAIIDASHDGLKSALAQNNKLPKDLLQNGLRPMLLNLSDYRKLTVTNLETLARLLVVLVNYFKVEIGSKLLHHANSWAMPQLLNKIAKYDLSNNTVIDIVNAIFNIFHLLPPKAYTFIPEVIKTLEKIEINLRRVKNSTCRESLVKFLNKYPGESSTYFFTQIDSRKIQNFHAYYVKHCPDLKSITKERIVTFFQFVEKETNYEKQVFRYASFLDVLEVTIEDEEDWIKDQGELMLGLFTLCEGLVNVYQSTFENKKYHFQMSYCMKKVQAIFVQYFKTESMISDLFFKVMNFLFMNKMTRSVCIDQFIFESIVQGDDTSKSQTLSRCISNVLEGSNTIDANVFLIKQICVPLILNVARENNGSIELLFNNNTEWFDLLHKNVWQSESELVVDHVAGKLDVCRLQLLEMTTVILKFAPQHIELIKKDVIKFSWNLMRLDDTLAKYAAYLCSCYFINAFETPSKITIHIFFALLKTNNGDARFLVKQSLDLLADVVSKSLENGEDFEFWTKWPRRVILENSLTINNIFVAYKFIVEHEELFFKARSQFLSNAISSMGKLTISPSSSAEFQVLAIELSELILKWEVRANTLRQNLGKEVDPKIEAAKYEAKFGKVTEKELEFRIPSNQKEAFVTFLIRYLCISIHKSSSTELGRRALSVLHESTKYWTEVRISLSMFEKFLLTADLNGNNPSTLCCCWNTLEVLGMILDNKSDTWIVTNLPQLQSLLIKVVKSHNVDIQEVFQKVLKIILEAIAKESSDDSESEDIKNFMTLLTNVTASDFNNTSSLYAGTTLFSTIAHVHYQSVRMNRLIPGLIKTFGKLCKDYVTLKSQRITLETTNQVEEEAKITAKLIHKILNIAAVRISYFGDHRRVFLSILAQFIDRVFDKELSKHIIDVVYKWIFENNGAFPTQKEKAALLSKMFGFDMRRDTPVYLAREYLKIIIKIFEDKTKITSDLPPRLEHAFLVGTKFIDIGIRQRFMKLLSASLNDNISDRLMYIIKGQNWDDIGEFPWIIQASELLFDSFDSGSPVSLRRDYYKFAPISYISEIIGPAFGSEVKRSVAFNQLMKDQNDFLQTVRSVTSRDITSSLVEVLHNDINSIKSTWVELFPVAYSSVPKSKRPEFSVAFTSLLSKDHHTKASGLKLNNVQALLEAACKCENLEIPPHLIKYLGLTLNAHYQAIEYLEARSPTFKNKIGDESIDNALTEMYLTIENKDIYYGIWRRRAKYNFTNIALSLEQVGMCDMAMKYYEHAQIKSRTRALPYSESEYSLWEDSWINCAEKLQHWDILTELSKHENYTDLLLECGWRVANWNDDKEPLEQSVKTVIDVPTTRRHIFKTFLCLQDFAQQKKKIEDVDKLCDEGVQLALKKWTTLPTRFTNAHIEVLHVFQQYVEFKEASHIHSSLVTTNTQNIDAKSQELKRVLQAWRERLPNVWDDINIWNDLINWRQHFFQLVNSIYTPFLKPDKANTYSQLYCGYHEIACVINRFAHVARKHGLDEVCISQLNRIYSLPNIEIMEAFLKLIEQVKCYYQNDNELYTGLDVISNTNLAYFGTKQKAEFFVLKGMFLAKLNNEDSADHAFGTAIQLDSNLAKAWAKWGAYNYKLYKKSAKTMDNNNQIGDHAKNALICFLHAVGLYKSSKSRRYLALILWIISLDDAKGTLASFYQNSRVEVPVWYWITYIPQLLTSLSHKEANFVKQILIMIAKSYPQALHFPLRTTKEDFLAIQKQISQNSQAYNGSNPKGDSETTTAVDSSKSEGSKQGGNHGGHPWEHVEEIMNNSKTSYPLLALSLESLVAQITSRFKSSQDEDAYRLIAALYNDGMQSFNRMLNIKCDGALPHQMVDNLKHFAETVLSRQVRTEFEKDFIKSNPSYETYIKRLIKWKERFENKLDCRVSSINLENLCPHLVEFHHLKFEDIEIPGQYLLNKDNNSHFIKIERFIPTIEVVRKFSGCYKRLKIRGKDGSVHQFAVQFPSNRHSRREERIFQLFRLFDGGIVRNVQCRSRNINFTLPVAVALSPHIRILSNDSNEITLQEVYEQTCKEKNQKIEDPFFYITEKLKATFDTRLPKPDIVSTMTEIFSAVQTLFVPSTIVRDFFFKSYPKFEDFWLFRNQFTSQYASFIFMTYMMSITSRQPQKISINMKSGAVWTSEMLPNKTSRYPSKKSDTTTTPNASAASSKEDTPTDLQKIPVFSNPEAVPFRLSPNIQKLIGNVGFEGILSVHVLLIARCLANPQFDIENFLSLFVRDEVISWFAQNLQTSAQGPHLREIVRENVDNVILKISRMDHVSNINPVSTHYVNELIATAVNPRSLAQLDYLWRPYL